GAGTVWVPLSAATSGTAASCSPPGARDVVVTIDVEARSDVVISVRGRVAEFAASLRDTCDDVGQELACNLAHELDDGSGVIRIRSRDREPGQLHLWLFAFSVEELELSVDFEEPSAAPSNEECVTASRISPGEFVLAPVLGSE